MVYGRVSLPGWCTAGLTYPGGHKVAYTRVVIRWHIPGLVRGIYTRVGKVVNSRSFFGRNRLKGGRETLGVYLRCYSCYSRLFPFLWVSLLCAGFKPVLGGF